MRTYMVQVDPDGSEHDPAKDDTAVGVYAKTTEEAAAIGLHARWLLGERLVRVAPPGPCPKAVHCFRAELKPERGVS